MRLQSGCSPITCGCRLQRNLWQPAAALVRRRRAAAAAAAAPAPAAAAVRCRATQPALH